MRILTLLAILLLSITGINELNAQNTGLQFESLPKEVQTALKKDYKKHVINSMEKAHAKGGALIYKVEVQKKSKIYRLVYSPTGILLNKFKMKAYSFDGSENNTDRKDNGGGAPIPPM
ncbi:MAG: hypothetical protein CL840_20610 [Crocinitomicaceae bacterium]|nr:hypothetical protein [Crocinitomicaceae bacterium]|tara:strand:- start:3522 stop:3875 length:354 start_codon:yes stop_codon:yes gene_type:complete